MREQIKKQGFVKLTRGFKPREGWPFWGKSVFAAFLILGFLGWSQGVKAQGFPTRPITLLINMAPGGGTDACARMIAEEASKLLGQEITPVNKGGGGGSVATGILASSKGDGYTLMAGPTGAITNSPHFESVPYDPVKDLIPIIQFGTARAAIIVRSDSPFNSLKDLIDFARKNPGKVTSGHTGTGSSLHLILEYLNLEEKVNIITVPFSGTTPAITALLGGHVTSGAIGNAFLPYFKAGKLKVLVSYTDKRTKDVPDVPTLRELGYRNLPGEGMMIIAAPRGTPLPIVEKLEGAFRKVVKSQEYRNLADNTFQMYPEDPLSLRDLKETLDKDYVINGELIRKIKTGK